MLDENAATTILPGVLVKISSKASMTSSSDPEKPLRSMLVLSPNSASTPCAAELGEAMEVELLAVDRRLVDLEVAGVDDARRPACGSPAPTQSGMLCVTRRNSILKGPTSTTSLRPDGPEAVLGARPCSSSLGAHERQRQRRAVDRTIDVRQQIGHGPDVVLVPVREHERRRRGAAAGRSGRE